ncbi:MAG TPA: hypothetical protein VFO46_05855, partial [Candidatus Sulfotelmatobacter sp.]|nr:hypothetical protein [Candidatus Sulfotelmatobacter sp.]
MLTILKSSSPKGFFAVYLLFLSSFVFGQQPSADSTGATSAQGIAISTTNPNQVAILRWYRSNQAATFAVGKGPGQAAFDGSSMWITNFSGGTVTKLRASDGAWLGNFQAGNSPAGIAYDGQ